MRHVKKYKIPFDDGHMRFSEKDYPSGLVRRIPIAEIDAVIRRLNAELAESVLPVEKQMRRWVTSSVILSFFGVGIFGVPVCIGLIYHFKREMRQYWARVRSFFALLNRRVYAGRRIEWRLVEDRAKMNRRDVVYPLLAYTVEVAYKRIPAQSDRRDRVPIEPVAEPQPVQRDDPKPEKFDTSQYGAFVSSRTREFETIALIENLSQAIRSPSSTRSPGSAASFETVEVQYSPRDYDTKA
jgi:hypothetical protein